MNQLLVNSKNKKITAMNILDDLQIIDQWKEYGRPIIVGAVSYDLIFDNDIDIEIYCNHLLTDHGFEILKNCAKNPNVRKIRFSNELGRSDEGLYWKIMYEDTNNEIWTIDMWAMEVDYNGIRSEDIINPMKAVLTDDLRIIILFLKKKLSENPEVICPSIYLYKAVIDYKITSLEGLKEWLENYDIKELINWKPIKNNNIKSLRYIEL